MKRQALVTRLQAMFTCLIFSTETHNEIGRWGQRHRDYINQYKITKMKFKI
jgi:hypothetical protein